MTESGIITQSRDTSEAVSTPPGKSHEQADVEGQRLTAWERASFFLAHASVAALLRALGIRGLYRFARGFGTIEWLVNFKRRRRFGRALASLHLSSLSPALRRRFTREHFMQTRCDKIFYLVFDCLPAQRARELFTIGNKGLLEAAVDSGRGAYVATSHHGSVHIAGLLMALSGYRIAGVRERRESALRRYIQDRLDRKYPDFQRARILFADSFPREIFRCLREGFLLGSSMDVSRTYHPNQRTEPVTLFGEQRHFLSGPLRVAYRCNVHALQAFIVPSRDFRYRLEIVETLFESDRPAGEDEMVGDAMRRYAANVERFLRTMPHLMSRL